MSASERERLAHALRELAASGRAMLIVEHDLRLMAALADDGHRARGRPRRLRSTPSQRVYA